MLPPPPTHLPLIDTRYIDESSSSLIAPTSPVSRYQQLPPRPGGPFRDPTPPPVEEEPVWKRKPPTVFYEPTDEPYVPCEERTDLDEKGYDADGYYVYSRETVPKPRAPYRKHTKRKLTELDKKHICEFHIEHPNARQEDIARQFGIERSTVSKILKMKKAWLEQVTKYSENTSRRRFSKWSEIDSDIDVKYLQKWTDAGIPITDKLLRDTALEIGQSYGLTSMGWFKCTQGWIERFKRRKKISGGVWYLAQAPKAAAFIDTPKRLDSPSVSFEQSTTKRWLEDENPPLPLVDPILDAPAVINPDHIDALQGDQAIQHSPDHHHQTYWQPVISPGDRPPVPNSPTLEDADHALATLANFFKKTDTATLLKGGELRAIQDIRDTLHNYNCNFDDRR
ncbi:hypothetical protein D9613_006061 [Agrocybe pediades]|uniref:HTH CENPB-type domain-containing protein n=1 Tax=Agrocybe pediades TaxID=84607 RepID=A0A8H4QW39_9AGAR|nr:hypothetical protein D9613_006061 [Agrocybe pediades]KAF9565680.1 hypothetical protein CPC08DRAFT_704384 [Agrocybe pediades]